MQKMKLFENRLTSRITLDFSKNNIARKTLIIQFLLAMDTGDYFQNVQYEFV